MSVVTGQKRGTRLVIVEVIVDAQVDVGSKNSRVWVVVMVVVVLAGQSGWSAPGKARVVVLVEGISGGLVGNGRGLGIIQ